MLGLVLAYLVSRSWTHLKYAWYVLRHLCLPRRQDFRKDAYVVYADADFELACLKLPQCLEPYGVRLLLRDREDMPGSVLAENIVLNIEHSWKVDVSDSMVSLHVIQPEVLRLTVVQSAAGRCLCMSYSQTV